MPLDALTPSSRLAIVAHEALQATFEAINHSLSSDQWPAIIDLLNHLERAANGSLEPAVYLSAIPAGTGKTTTIIEFAKALMGDPTRASVGMLVTCNRVEEVEALAGKLGAWRDWLCVIVGEKHDKVRAMGDHETAQDAQVVVCTQAAIKQSLKSLRSFDDATRFHYQGRRRAIVAWDEALRFNRPVVLNPYRALRLAEALESIAPAASDALLQWVPLVRAAKEGHCEVPDFEAHGVDFPALEAAVADDEDTLAQAQALGVISGRTGYVIPDNRGGLLISYTPELPPNLMPVIVTDASAARHVHHASYAQMEGTRRIIRLKEASKTYHNMTLRIAPISASRSTYRDQKASRGKELINMAVAYVQRVAPERVLIVSYKNRFRMKGVAEGTIKEAINARLSPVERLRVSHLTWGRHTATNEHHDTPHVLLMGLNFLPRAASHAASGAALDKPMQTNAPDDHPTDTQVDDMHIGMLRDATLQALLRGNARKGVDGDCGTMTAVIPQVPQTGISDDDYRKMFPGVNLLHDASLVPAKPLRGKLRALSEIVVARMEAGDTEMANPDLAREMRMDLSNFRALVKRRDWQAWMVPRGLVRCRLKGRATGIRRTWGLSWTPPSP